MPSADQLPADIEALSHRNAHEISDHLLFQQELSDFPIAHMRRSSKRSLKVAPTPIPRGIEQAGLQLQEFLRTLQICVGGHDELFHQVSSQCRAAVWHIRHR
jgi:hypothetical protein